MCISGKLFLALRKDLQMLQIVRAILILIEDQEMRVVASHGPPIFLSLSHNTLHGNTAAYSYTTVPSSLCEQCHCCTNGTWLESLIRGKLWHLPLTSEPTYLAVDAFTSHLEPTSVCELIPGKWNHIAGATSASSCTCWRRCNRRFVQLNTIRAEHPQALKRQKNNLGSKRRPWFSYIKVCLTKYYAAGILNYLWGKYTSYTFPAACPYPVTHTANIQLLSVAVYFKNYRFETCNNPLAYTLKESDFQRPVT